MTRFAIFQKLPVSGHLKWKDLDCWLGFTILSWPCEISSELRLPQPARELGGKAGGREKFVLLFQLSAVQKTSKPVFVKDWHLQPEGLQCLSCHSVFGCCLLVLFENSAETEGVGFCPPLL